MIKKLFKLLNMSLILLLFCGCSTNSENSKDTLGNKIIMDVYDSTGEKLEEKNTVKDKSVENETKDDTPSKIETPINNTIQSINHGIIEGLVSLSKIVNDGGIVSDEHLLFAVIFGDVEIVDFILSQGVDVNVQDEEGNNALMLALMHGKYEMIETLMNQGIDLNTKNNYMETVEDIIDTTDKPHSLGFALKIIDVDTLSKDELVEISKELNQALKDGNVPLVESFLSSGVDLLYYEEAEYGERTVHTMDYFWGYHDNHDPIEIEKQKAIIQLLIKYGFDFNKIVYSYFYGSPFIDIIMSNFSIEAIDLIMQNGYEYDASIVFLAVYSQDLQIEKVKYTTELVTEKYGIDYLLNYQYETGYEESYKVDILTAVKDMGNKELQNYFNSLIE